MRATNDQHKPIDALLRDEAPQEDQLMDFVRRGVVEPREAYLKVGG